jgi:hypothetical protein
MQNIGKIQGDHYETFLVYLVILLLTNANDIHLNPGPRTEREYLCGTCDKTVNWEERGVICETCDQWYMSEEALCLFCLDSVVVNPGCCYLIRMK